MEGKTTSCNLLTAITSRVADTENYEQYKMRERERYNDKKWGELYRLLLKWLQEMQWKCDVIGKKQTQRNIEEKE